MHEVLLNLKREDLSDFCTIVNKFNSEFDVCSGRYVIDAKSLLGLFTLNFVNEIKLSIILKDDDNLDDILKAIEKYTY